MGANWSSSDAQRFNRGKPKRRIENGRLGLSPSEPLGPGELNLHYFLLGDNDAFALMPWLVKPYSRRQVTREERIANYRISRGRRVVENSFGILVNRFRVLLTTMEQRPKVVRDIVLTCVVLQSMLRNHQGGSRQTTHSSGRHITTTGRPGGTGTISIIRLFQSYGGTGWVGQQSLIRLWGEHVVIYQSFSGLPK